MIRRAFRQLPVSNNIIVSTLNSSSIVWRSLTCAAAPSLLSSSLRYHSTTTDMNRGGGGGGDAHQQQQQQQQAAVPLRSVLNQFKRAGAHPDLISSIDAEKASENGRMLIELERALSERQDDRARAAWLARRKQKQTSLEGGDDDEGDRIKLQFWLRRQQEGSSSSAKKQTREPVVRLEVVDPDPMETAKHLRKVTCVITPWKSDEVVHEQLSQLFEAAGVSTNFVLPTTTAASRQHEINSKHLNSALHSALNNKAAVSSSSSSLLTRMETAAGLLRSRGVVVALRDQSGTSYLVTMPESARLNREMNLSVASTAPATASRAPSTLTNPDPREMDFLSQRGFTPFDARVLVSSNTSSSRSSNSQVIETSSTAAEQIVDRVEQLAQWYVQYQGTCLRPGVCYILDNSSSAPSSSSSSSLRVPRITSDGCISLPMLCPHLWQDFLFSLSQPQWTMLMKAQEDWRSHRAVLLNQRLAHLSRIGDMLHFHRMSLVGCGAGSMNDQWVNNFVDNFLKEEVAIRKTVDKYADDLKFKALKQRGVIECSNNPSPSCRVCGDGTVLFSSTTSPIGLLKFLRAKNGRKAARAVDSYSQAASKLEHVGHMTGLRIGVETAWKRSADDKLCDKLQHCVNTLTSARSSLATFSKNGGWSLSLMVVGDEYYDDHAGSVSGSVVRPQPGASGVVPIRWNIKAQDLSIHVLSR